MIRFVPFAPLHIAELAALPGNAALKIVLEEDAVYAESLAKAGPCWTGLRRGEVIGCAGFKHEWPGRATAWMVAAPEITRREWVAIRAKVRREIAALEAAGVWRVESNVLECFASARRFAESIGFEREAVNRAFDPRGRDSVHYAFINREALP